MENQRERFATLQAQKSGHEHGKVESRALRVLIDVEASSVFAPDISIAL